MEQQKIDMFISVNKDCFTLPQIQMIKDRLANLPDDKSTLVMASSYKNPTIMLIISIFLGEFGIDRFLVGDIGLGVAKLLTCGGFGIWAIIDWFLIRDKTFNYNMQKFNEALMY